MTLGHSTAPRDHIDQRAHDWHNDQEDNPDSLPPAAQILITEQIDDDLEQNDQVAGENEGPHQQPEEIREIIHSAVPLSASENLCLLGCELLLGQHTGCLELPEFLKLGKRVILGRCCSLWRRRRICRLLRVRLLLVVCLRLCRLLVLGCLLLVLSS